MNCDPNELRQGLNQFSGSETWYRHSINRNMLYTDGVQYFAETAGAYWLLDIVATEFMRLQRQEPFLSITLKASGSKAKIVVTDGGRGGPEVVLKSKRIQFTTCPEGDWKFYLVDNVLMLPTEY